MPIPSLTPGAAVTSHVAPQAEPAAIPLTEPSAVANALRRANAPLQDMRRRLIVDWAIAAIRTPRNWDNYAGDIAPVLLGVSGLVGAGRGIVIWRHDNTPHASFGPQHAAVQLRYSEEMDHYDVPITTAAGLQILAVPGDGDCLFHAVLASARNIPPDQVSDDDVLALRNRVADYLANNRERFAEAIEQLFIQNPPPISHISHATDDANDTGYIPAHILDLPGASSDRDDSRAPVPRAVPRLPHELIDQIIRQAPTPQDAARWESVSRSCRVSALSDGVWQRFLQSDAVTQAKENNTSCKDWCRTHPAARLSPFVPPESWLEFEQALYTQAERLTGEDRSFPRFSSQDHLPNSLLRLVHDGRLSRDTVAGWLKETLTNQQPGRYKALLGESVADAVESRHLPLETLSRWLNDATLEPARLQEGLACPMMALLQAGLPWQQLETWMRAPGHVIDDLGHRHTMVSRLSEIMSLHQDLHLTRARYLVEAHRQNPQLLDEILAKPVDAENWHDLLPYLSIRAPARILQLLPLQSTNRGEWRNHMEYLRLVAKHLGRALGREQLAQFERQTMPIADRCRVFRLVELNIPFALANSWVMDPAVCQKRLRKIAGESIGFKPKGLMYQEQIEAYLRNHQVSIDKLSLLPALSQQLVPAQTRYPGEVANLKKLMKQMDRWMGDDSVSATRLAAAFGIPTQFAVRAGSGPHPIATTAMQALTMGTLSVEKLDKWLRHAGISDDRLKAALRYAAQVDEPSLEISLSSSHLDADATRRLGALLTSAQPWLRDGPSQEARDNRLNRLARWQHNPVLRNFSADLVTLLSHGKEAEVRLLEQMTREPDQWQDAALRSLFGQGKAAAALCTGAVSLKQLLGVCIGKSALWTTEQDIVHLAQHILPAVIEGKFDFETVRRWWQALHTVAQPPDATRCSLMFSLADTGVPLATLTNWMRNRVVTSTETWKAALNDTAVREALKKGWLSPEQLQNLLCKPRYGKRPLAKALTLLLKEPLRAVGDGSLPIETLESWCRDSRARPETTILSKIEGKIPSDIPKPVRKTLFQELLAEPANRPQGVVKKDERERRQPAYVEQSLQKQRRLHDMHRSNLRNRPPEAGSILLNEPTQLAEAFREISAQVDQALKVATPATQPALESYRTSIAELRRAYAAGQLALPDLAPTLAQAAQQLAYAVDPAQPHPLQAVGQASSQAQLRVKRSPSPGALAIPDKRARQDDAP